MAVFLIGNDCGSFFQGTFFAKFLINGTNKTINAHKIVNQNDSYKKIGCITYSSPCTKFIVPICEPYGPLKTKVIFSLIKFGNHDKTPSLYSPAGLPTTSELKKLPHLPIA